MSETTPRKRLLGTSNRQQEVTQVNASVRPGGTLKGCSVLCARIGLVLVTTAVLLVLCLFAWPSGLKARAFRFQPPVPFEGGLALNTRLRDSRKLFKGKISGPESIAIRHGHIYTGTADGKILDIHNDTIRVLARLGKEPCGLAEYEATCGRPLGVRLDPSDGGSLIVVDGYLGVFRVDTETGHSRQLFSTNTSIAGHKSKFLNDVTVTSQGVIYVTDSSVTWDRRHFRMLGVELNPDGRVIMYDPVHDTMEVVCNGVYANGIQLTSQEDAVLLCETPLARIVKCYIRGKRVGQIEMLSDNLPGYPDNIRLSSSGSHWVALTAVRHPDKPLPMEERLAPYPAVRQTWQNWRSLSATVTAFYRHVQGQISGTSPPSRTRGPKKSYGMIIEISDTGAILRSFHDPTGSVVGISHVEESNGTLYLGSATNDYIGFLQL